MKFKGIPAIYTIGSKSLFGENFISDDEMGLYILTHGSSNKHGAWASKSSIQSIFNIIKKRFPEIQEAQKITAKEGQTRAMAVVADAMKHTSQLLHQEIRKDPEKQGLFSTAVVAICLQESAIIAHAGNCRAYLLRDELPILLTKDHTLYQEMKESGEDSFSKINPSFKKVLTRSLGGNEALVVSTRVVPLSEGDQILLCTTGLSSHLSSTGDEIRNLLRSTSTSDELNQSLEKFFQNIPHKEHVTIVDIVAYEGTRSIKRSDYVSIRDKIETLRTIPLFRGIWGLPDELMKMANLFVSRDVPPGTEVIKEGEQSDEMFVVLDGKVDILFKGQTVAVIERLGLIGEIGFLTQKKRTAMARAQTSAKLLVLNKKDFYRLLQQDKDLVIKFTFGVIDELSKKILTGNSEMAMLKQGKKKAA